MAEDNKDAKLSATEDSTKTGAGKASTDKVEVSDAGGKKDAVKAEGKTPAKGLPNKGVKGSPEGEKVKPKADDSDKDQGVKDLDTDPSLNLFDLKQFDDAEGSNKEQEDTKAKGNKDVKAEGQGAKEDSKASHPNSEVSDKSDNKSADKSAGDTEAKGKDTEAKGKDAKVAGLKEVKDGSYWREGKVKVVGAEAGDKAKEELPVAKKKDSLGLKFNSRSKYGSELGKSVEGYRVAEQRKRDEELAKRGVIAVPIVYKKVPDASSLGVPDYSGLVPDLPKAYSIAVTKEDILANLKAVIVSKLYATKKVPEFSKESDLRVKYPDYTLQYVRLNLAEVVAVKGDAHKLATLGKEPKVKEDVKDYGTKVSSGVVVNQPNNLKGEVGSTAPNKDAGTVDTNEAEDKNSGKALGRELGSQLGKELGSALGQEYHDAISKGLKQGQELPDNNKGGTVSAGDVFKGSDHVIDDKVADHVDIDKGTTTGGKGSPANSGDNDPADSTSRGYEPNKADKVVDAVSDQGSQDTEPNGGYTRSGADHGVERKRATKGILASVASYGLNQAVPKRDGMKFKNCIEEFKFIWSGAYVWRLAYFAVAVIAVIVGLLIETGFQGILSVHNESVVLPFVVNTVVLIVVALNYVISYLHGDEELLNVNRLSGLTKSIILSWNHADEDDSYASHQFAKLRKLERRHNWIYLFWVLMYTLFLSNALLTVFKFVDFSRLAMRGHVLGAWQMPSWLGLILFAVMMSLSLMLMYVSYGKEDIVGAEQLFGVPKQSMVGFESVIYRYLTDKTVKYSNWVVYDAVTMGGYQDLIRLFGFTAVWLLAIVLMMF